MSTPNITHVDLDVPELGTITGLCFDGTTTQYQCIPYASRAVFVAPSLRRHGRIPPRDFYPIPNQSRPWVENPPMSSTECLNLNISVPTAPLGSSEEKPMYPVMVFFHGGAFTYAAGGAAIYDGRMLAEMGRKDFNMPTIIVTPTFGLGVYGFLASKEIAKYNKEFREEGVGNYGLWDQVEALRWVQKQIAAFGGSPERVCCFGQSAGGVSTDVHMRRGEKLFSTAIIQSGLLPLCGVMRVEQYQVMYDKILDELVIPAELAPRERLQKLLEVPEEKLTAAMMPVCMIPVISFGPCDDSVLIGGPMPKYADYAKFKPPEWCQSMMIGDVKNEAVIWNKTYRDIDGKGLVTRIKSFLKDDGKAQKLMDWYGINEEMDHNTTFWKIEQFATDGLFVAVDWTALRANPAMYTYHFDVPSPFKNDWGGLAHHSLHNVYIWGLLKDHLPPNYNKVSRQMTAAWLALANGKDPWDRFDRSKRFMVFTENGGEMRSVEENAERGYSKWKEIEREGFLHDFRLVCDDICMRQSELTDPAVKPKMMGVKDLSAYAIKAKIDL